MAKESCQNSIILKIDLSKSYNRVDWTFKFQVMENLGMLHSFIHMIGLLFQDVVVSINVNNQVTEPFELHRGVHQGCPLAPCSLLLQKH